MKNIMTKHVIDAKRDTCGITILYSVLVNCSLENDTQTEDQVGQGYRNQGKNVTYLPFMFYQIVTLDFNQRYF